MSGSDVQKIVAKVVEAHGGASRWHKLEAIEAIISVRGFLFKAKRRPTLSRVRIRASIREPKFTFFDYPRTGRNCNFIGNEEVRITDAGNQVLVSRLQPRAAIRRIRKMLYWDALDFTYFGGYATWNYLDYTAEVVSRWAHAAHICENYQDFDGFKFPTKRRVLPLLIGKRPLTGPVIVAIDIHELRFFSSADK